AAVVIVSVPERVAIEAAPKILAAMQPGALWVDVVAVKGPIATTLAGGPVDREILSIHPLFAPQAGFAGRNVLALPIRDGERSRDFLAMLARWGARVSRFDPADHDRHVAMVQVATHAALLAFAAALGELGYDPERGTRLGTPPHRALVALVARILSFSPAGYWEVQASNPHGKEVRAQIRAALDELDRLVSLGDAGGFEAWMAACAGALEPKLGELSRDAARMVAALGPAPTAPTTTRTLERFRGEVDALDEVLLDLLGTRFAICRS